MILTRQEKEKLILDLYNEGKTYKQIAETVRVSPRDIKPVLEKAEKERERELRINIKEGDNSGTGDRKTQKTYAFSQAYSLFSEGKTPLEVAIELNMKESEVTKHYREYWKLNQMHTLNMIYEEIGDDILHIYKIHRKIRAAGMRVDQAVDLIKNAHNDLPTLEQKYQKLKREVNLLESRKLDEYKTLSEIQDQIDRSEKMQEWLERSCREEEANINKLEKEKIRLKRLVKLFKENDEEYLRIKNTVTQYVTGILFDGKRLLHLSLSSLMDSMRTDPHRYSKLIYYKGSSSSENIDWQYTGYNQINRQQPYPSFESFYDEYESTLLENAQKLYNKSAKEWTEQIIKEYSIKNASTHNKLLRPDEERQQQLCYKLSNELLLPTAISNNQAFHIRGVNRIFVRTGLPSSTTAIADYVGLDQ